MSGIIGLLLSKVSVIPKELIPAVSLGMIVVALVLVIVFFGICVLYINSKPKPQIIRKETKVDVKSPIPARIRHEDLPIISGRLGEILTLYGFLKAGPVTKIFFKVLEILKNSTYDIRWRYKHPCFMMVGSESSGKSTLLENLNFEHLTADGSAVDSMWKLFKKGIIFELPKIETGEDEDKFWSFLSELFVFIRPRRPLDGIIVTVPADILLSDMTNIETHAREMFEKIFAFQREVNFRLPIYLIVTKTDLVPGFSEFAHLLSNDSKQQIFGWSCPYSINHAFSTEWIREIFQTVDEGIKKGILHLSHEKKISADLEAAILFASQFRKIQAPLSKYLCEMFRSHSPEDGLILRGVYFVGKSKVVETVSSELVQLMAISPKLFVNIDTNLAHSYNDRLYFAQDLFKDKIFKEHNIAYPICAEAIDMNKVEYRNKIIFATGSIIVSLGWFWGNNVIKNKIRDYYQIMSPIKNSMIKIKYLENNLKGEEDQALINKYTIKLLQSMPVVKWADLSSIFVPQSWFSSLRNELMGTIGLIFDSVVVRAMYIDLNLDTKKILQNFHTSIEGHHQKKDLFDVNSFLSFKNLKEFVRRISNIKRISAEYNAIRQLEDRKSIVDLTSTIFKDKFEIAEAMKSHIPNKKLMLPKFDITLFQSRIEANLRSIFAAFLQDVFDKTIEKILQSVSEDIDKIIDVSKSAAATYSSQDLAKTYRKTLLIADILKNKKFAWIANDRFSPTNEYNTVIADMRAANIVSEVCVKELLQLAETEFHQFKSRLREYKTDLTDALLSENITTPSTGFENFQKEIHALLEQPFICSAPNGNLITTILEDKMLIWDLKRLKELSELIDKYYEFSTTMPPDMRAQFFDMYKTIARKCFYPTLRSMLGNAQIFDDMPLGHSRDLLEDAYKRQASNIRNASFAIPKIAKIIDEMQEEDNQKDFGFSSMLIPHYLSLLEKIDALFNLETPYSSGSAVFDNWSGDKNPKFLNFEDQEGLKQYLTAQFARIKFLAKELASPIVDLLSMPHIFDKIKNPQIIEKWKSIISSVDDYEAKKPGNSIAALESFLSDNLSKVSIDSFDDKGEIRNISETGGDFFLSKRSDVAKSLISRADVVQYDKASVAYNAINKFFNESLSHKFPFGTSEAEASVRDIERFVDLYEQNGNIYPILERNKDKKGISHKVFDFLKGMNKLIPFLKAWISQSKGSDVSTAPVSFNIQLRPAPNLEALTSSLLDRAININDSSVADNSESVFFNNDRVNAVFDWVASSNEKPYEQGSSKNLSINRTKVTFSYAGKWAMFRLIEENKINKEIESPNGILVQFNVPIVDSNKGNNVLTSKIVLKITPILKDGDKPAPLAWPIFPKFCPDLYGHERSVDLTSEESSTATANASNINAGVSFEEEVPAVQNAAELSAEVAPQPVQQEAAENNAVPTAEDEE
ncbi:MAG: hypothetical protein LBS23_02080 [Holosporaceae bacterium]|jgi:type VI secretion system protein ImpL|nr:hypothetical protein [Holosporaceae bacterium]